MHLEMLMQSSAHPECDGFADVLQGESACADGSVYCLQGFSLKTLKHLVLDEADRLLNMDFEQEIDQILKARSPLPRLQTALQQ